MKVGFTKKAQKNYPKDKIKKGESFYFWKFKNRDIQRSKTYPKDYQLRKYPVSEYAEKIAYFNEEIERQNDVDKNEDLYNEINEYISELEERLSNIPEQLQESSILNERIEEMNELLESVV